MATVTKEERPALTILWRIENFSCFDPEVHGCVIDSPIFNFRVLGGWSYLKLFPGGLSDDDKNLRLSLFGGGPFDTPIDCEFSFVSCDGSPLVNRIVRNQEIKWNTFCDMPDCPTKKEVFENKKSIFLSHNSLTVRCRIWKSSGSFALAEYFSAHSRIEIAEDCSLCPIEDFSKDNLDNTPIPVCLKFSHELVCLKLSGLLTIHELQNYNLCIEIAASEIRETLLVNLELHILDTNLKKLRSMQTKLKFFKSPTKQTRKLLCQTNLPEDTASFLSGKDHCLLWHLRAVRSNISHFIDRKFIGSSKLKHTARNDSIFTEASCKTSPQSDPTHLHLQVKKDSVDVLLEDFQSLYREQTFTDFELRAGEVSFPVHKNVLSARSPVFRAMFSSDMEEASSKFQHIPDLDAHTLNRMLFFLYTGTVEQDLRLGSAVKLYYAADKYQVESLKRQCSSILQSDLSVSNVSDILKLADRHQDQDLISFVHDFILDRFDEVMHSEEWEKFLETDSYLAGKSMHTLYKKKKQNM